MYREGEGRVNGVYKPITPRFTSSAARSMSTHSDQMTHKAAAEWKSTEQQSRRLSMLEMSRLRHCQPQCNRWPGTVRQIETERKEAKQCAKEKKRNKNKNNAK